MSTIRLTMAQALVRFLAAQRTALDGEEQLLFAGIFAIFGHGNVAGLGEALYAAREALPTLRAHNEQAMAHAAIAYAKTLRRRRMMACTTSIGPGATNMVTAAALAHVNRLPVLLLPGDIFAGRRPDPVLQQVEVFADPTVSANDCFRPVSRFWDRITRPEQILQSLPQAMRVLTDPAECGPVTLCLPQDVQTEAYDYPAEFFRPRRWLPRRPPPDADQLAAAVAALARAQAPPSAVEIAGSVAMTMTKVRGAARASASAASSSAMPATRRETAPRLAAWAAKSTPDPEAKRLLKLAPPVAPCSRLMQPKPPLSSSTMVSLAPSCTEVAISEFIMRYEPSPTITTTSRPGAASLTPSPPAIS